MVEMSTYAAGKIRKRKSPDPTTVTSSATDVTAWPNSCTTLQINSVNK
jgi:hypothetical protein